MCKRRTHPRTKNSRGWTLGNRGEIFWRARGERIPFWGLLSKMHWREGCWSVVCMGVFSTGLPHPSFAPPLQYMELLLAISFFPNPDCASHFTRVRRETHCSDQKAQRPWTRRFHSCLASDSSAKPIKLHHCAIRGFAITVAQSSAWIPCLTWIFHLDILCFLESHFWSAALQQIHYCICTSACELPIAFGAALGTFLLHALWSGWSVHVVTNLGAARDTAEPTVFGVKWSQANPRTWMPRTLTAFGLWSGWSVHVVTHLGAGRGTTEPTVFGVKWSQASPRTWRLRTLTGDFWDHAHHALAYAFLEHAALQRSFAKSRHHPLKGRLQRVGIILSNGAVCWTSLFVSCQYPVLWDAVGFPSHPCKVALVCAVLAFVPLMAIAAFLTLHHLHAGRMQSRFASGFRCTSTTLRPSAPDRGRNCLIRNAGR